MVTTVAVGDSGGDDSGNGNSDNTLSVATMVATDRNTQASIGGDDNNDDTDTRARCKGAAVPMTTTTNADNTLTQTTKHTRWHVGHVTRTTHDDRTHDDRTHDDNP